MILLGSVSLLAADPFIGKWNFNAARSKFPSDRKPFAHISLAAFEDNGYHRTWDRPDGQGTDQNDFILDGKEHKSENGRSTTSKRVDAHHFHSESTLKGKVSEDYVVSPDGKTLTITRKGVGVVTKRAVDDLLVYELQ